MRSCYDPIACPTFIAENSDCDVVAHDLAASGGSLSSDAPAISAALIQLGTDGRGDNGGGWWGDAFQPFEIGSRMWELFGSTGDPARMEAYVREAMAPLIDQGLFEAVQVSTVQTVRGFEVLVDASRAGRSIFEVKL